MSSDVERLMHRGGRSSARLEGLDFACCGLPGSVVPTVARRAFPTCHDALLLGERSTD
jgi:hypothetical protein